MKTTQLHSATSWHVGMSSDRNVVKKKAESFWKCKDQAIEIQSHVVATGICCS